MTDATRDQILAIAAELIIKAADDAGLCFPTCWGLVDAEEDAADDAAFAATSPEAAEIVAKHEQLKRDRLQQLRNFWNTAASYGADQELEGPTDEEIMRLMPQQMHEDLAAAARALAEQASTVSASSTGIMRIILNRHAVDLARAVLARWGRPVNEAELQEARDEELDACCEWLRHEYWYGEELALKLRAAAR